MKEFKKGDIVKLKECLVVSKLYDGTPLLSGMVFEGRRKIHSVDPDNTVLLINNHKAYWYPFSIIEHVKN